MGPTLAELAGREAGTLEGFNFSEALANSGVIWNKQSLDEFLRSPVEFIPGNAMPFSGIKNDSERARLIEFLLAC